jgi:hypothetical protein
MLDNFNLNDKDKNKVIQFVDDNELDYHIIDDDKFKLIASNSIVFTIGKYQDNYVVIKYNQELDTGDPINIPYEYYNFNNLNDVLIQFKNYDNGITKTYFIPISNVLDISIGKIDDGWYNDLNLDNNWKVSMDDLGEYVYYENSNVKPKVKSPFNTLHEVSEINDIRYETIDKLYLELHSIGDDTYLGKILCNNEEIMKEYVNYIIYSKVGIKKFLESIFDSNITKIVEN